MKHLIETMKYTIPFSGRLFRASIILLFAMLIPLFIGPVDARESGRFHFLLSGDVIGEDEANNRIRKNNTVLWGSFDPGMELDINFFKDKDYKNGSGANCFPDGSYAGPFHISQQHDGTAQLAFYFRANGTDGSPDHKYVLALFGIFDDDTNFPPAVGTEVEMAALVWVMSTEGKGQAQKVTCTGDGEDLVDTTVTVRRIY